MYYSTRIRGKAATEGCFALFAARCGGSTRTSHVIPREYNQSMTPGRERNLRSSEVELTSRSAPGSCRDGVGLLEVSILQGLSMPTAASVFR